MGRARPEFCSVARPWPKKMAEQVQAVRDLVTRGASTWSEAEVARAFTAAKKKEVTAVLESLAALGIVLGMESKGELKYRAAIRAA